MSWGTDSVSQIETGRSVLTERSRKAAVEDDVYRTRTRERQVTTVSYLENGHSLESAVLRVAALNAAGAKNINHAQADPSGQYHVTWNTITYGGWGDWVLV